MTASIDTLQTVRSLSREGYKYGFVTEIDTESAPPGLNEDTVRFISEKKVPMYQLHRSPSCPPSQIRASSSAFTS